MKYLNATEVKNWKGMKQENAEKEESNYLIYITQKEVPKYEICKKLNLYQYITVPKFPIQSVKQVQISLI